MATELKTVEAGHQPLYVLSPLAAEFLQPGERDAFVVPVMSRRDGVILAVPSQFLSQLALDRGQAAVGIELIGPSQEVTILGVDEDEQGGEIPSGVEITCLLVDFHLSVIEALMEYDNAASPMPSRCFLQDSPTMLPMSSSLLSAALDWINGSPDTDRIQFYSAAEEEVKMGSSLLAPGEKKKAKPVPAPKRVTTAALADQLGAISHSIQSIPQIAQQLNVLQEKQKKIEQAVMESAVPRPPAHKMPFPAVTQDRPEVAEFLRSVGAPPRARTAPSTPAPVLGLAEDEPVLLPSEEGFLQQLVPPAADLSHAVFQQSQALTALVAHLVGQDGLTDLAGSSSSLALTSKGASRRNKLLADLASREGQFFLAVAQNAFRRLKPTEPLPTDLKNFPNKAIFSKYLERQGGFNGQRDLGLTMWLLAQIADQMVCGDVKGAQEMMALTLVALEQCAQDGGRWDLAWVLSLQEDPPPSIFAARPPQTNPRLKAFAPLCPAPWTMVALNYVKELDTISSRRTEMRGGGKPAGGGQTETSLSKEEECASFVVGGKLDSKKDGLSSRAWRAPDELMQFGSSFSVGRGGDESHGPDLSNSSSVADLGSGSFSCKEATSLPKTWGNMQEYSYRTWCRELLGKVMNSRTSFSSFLRSTLMAKPSAEHARANLLFPLPIPKFGIFESRKRSSRARRTCYEDRAFHILVMALNFLHSDFKRVPLDVLSLKPNPCQAATLLRLKGTLKVFGSCHGAFSVPDSGRRSMNLVSLLADLSDFVTWEGLSGSSYDRSFPGAAGGLGERRSVPYDRSRAEELTPYRPLDPSRLVLHGRAHWDPSPFLPDSLWLPFKEPNVLLWCDEPQAGLGVLKNESEKVVEELARVWDVNGLLFLRAPDEGDLRPHDTMRVFNCYKNSSCDRQITDRRSRNYLESRILGDSRGLPAAFALSILEVRPFEQRLSICCSDRKDFYHQFAVSAARAATNVCAPAVDAEKLKDTLAYRRMLDRAEKSKSASREQRGDFLGQEPRKRGLLVPEKVHVCVGSIGQGDHLGVEFATAAHRRMLQSFGLLQEDSELRGDRVFLGDRLLEGLVIDDYYTISVEDEPLEESMMLVGGTGLSDSVAVGKMQVASGAYEAHALAGSPHKDVWDADKAKVTGAEIDSSVEARKRGLVTLGAPMQKRLALAFVSLELAGLRFSSDVLTSCLVGGWTSAAMFRRQFVAILSDLYKVCDFSSVDQNSPQLVSLGAGARQELVMLAVLCPLMTTNLGAEVSPVLYATDASEQLGAFVETDVDEELARVLWRTGNRKGGYSHLMNRFEALLQKIDEDFEPHVKEDDASGASPDRPLAFRYHFIEVCGGAGKISSFLGEKGWVVGPVIDLDRSGFYDLQLLELVSWLIHLVEEGLLDSFIVEPPCTTFSAAAYPPLRSYVLPRGFDPSHCRTHIGTTLALRALTLMYIAARAMLPALLEQPLLSKMAWLEEWKRLLEELSVYERKTSSCMYGSPHRKEFRFLVANMETDAMSLRCDRSHSHVKIEGKFTKASAVYVDGLAEAIAVSFDKALARKLRLDSHREKTKPGLEMPLLNDLLVSSEWKVGRAWRWKSRAHINILETATVGRLLKNLAREKPSTRMSIAVDSHVALASIAKGRSPSLGLRQCLRRIAAIVLAGDLYPALHFAPTRLNPADHPSRMRELLEALKSCRAENLTKKELFQLARVSGLKKGLCELGAPFPFCCRGKSSLVVFR